MTDRLKISIEKLYDIFAKYQGLSKLEGSPLYDDLEIWNKQIRSKKLRELTDEDLSLFAGKVILTWGDENDYLSSFTTLLIGVDLILIQN